MVEELMGPRPLACFVPFSSKVETSHLAGALIKQEGKQNSFQKSLKLTKLTRHLPARVSNKS